MRFPSVGVRTVIPHAAEKTAMGWPIEPDGLTEMLVRLKDEYTELPIYITETALPSTTTQIPKVKSEMKSGSRFWTHTSGRPEKRSSRGWI